MNRIWIARNKDGSLFFYDKKPIGHDSTSWIVSPDCMNERIGDDWFPEITWENSPIELVPHIMIDGRNLNEIITKMYVKVDELFPESKGGLNNDSTGID